MTISVESETISGTVTRYGRTLRAMRYESGPRQGSVCHEPDSGLPVSDNTPWAFAGARVASSFKPDPSDNDERNDVPNDESTREGSMISVKLTPRVTAELERLHHMLGISKTDVVNRAVSMYHFTEQQLISDRQLAIYDPRTEEFQLVNID